MSVCILKNIFISHRINRIYKLIVLIRFNLMKAQIIQKHIYFSKTYNHIIIYLLIYPHRAIEVHRLGYQHGYKS